MATFLTPPVVFIRHKPSGTLYVSARINWGDDDCNRSEDNKYSAPTDLAQKSDPDDPRPSDFDKSQLTYEELVQWLDSNPTYEAVGPNDLVTFNVRAPHSLAHLTTLMQQPARVSCPLSPL